MNGIPKKEDSPSSSVNSEKIDLDFTALKTLVPNPQKIASLSDGFNVERFEILLKTKIKEQQKKSLSYNSKYLSVTSIIGCLRRYYYQKKKYEIEWEKQFTYAYIDLIVYYKGLMNELQITWPERWP